MRRIGPGPAKYMLPPTVGYVDHDATRYRNPQYSIGFRPAFHAENVGPGPAKWQIENKTRFGDPSYQAFIGQRLYELSKDILFIFI